MAQGISVTEHSGGGKWFGAGKWQLCEVFQEYSRRAVLCGAHDMI